MRQLVQNDVVPHRLRHLDQPPVQRNRPMPRTRSPTRPLISHPHAAHGEAVLLRQSPDARRQFRLCHRPKMLFEPRTHVIEQVLDSDSLVRKPNHQRTIRRARRQKDRFSAKQDLAADKQPCRTQRALLPPPHLPLDPLDLSVCKAAPFGSRTAARNCHARHALGRQPENVASGAAMPHELQRHPCRANRQRGALVSGGSQRRKEKLGLHRVPNPFRSCLPLARVTGASLSVKGKRMPPDKRNDRASVAA